MMSKRTSMSQNWVSKSIYSCMLALDQRNEISLADVDVQTIHDVSPNTFSRFKLPQLKALLKELRSRKLFNVSRIPTLKPDLLMLLISNIQRLSPNASVFASHPNVIAYRDDAAPTAHGSSARKTDHGSQSIALYNPAQVVNADPSLVLSFDNRTALVDHITHLRRFRLATNPLQRLVEPMRVAPFHVSNSSGRQIEFRALLSLKRPPEVATGERIILRIFAERPPFRLQADSLNTVDIKPPRDLDPSTLCSTTVIGRYTPGHVDNEFVNQPHLHRHPGARGNDPALGSPVYYPSETADRIANHVLRHGVVLPIKDPRHTQVWVNGSTRGVRFPEFEEGVYNSMHLNKHKKRAVPIVGGVDVTEAVTRAKGSCDIEVAMLLSSVDDQWSGCVVAEVVKDVTIDDIGQTLLQLPRVSPLFHVPEPQPEPKCASCGVDATLGCSGCKHVYYCSEEHQRADYDQHWAVCHRSRELRALRKRGLQQEQPSMDDDDEVVIGDQSIPLECPISRGHMKFPVRGVKCEHQQCFDLSSYIMLSRQQGTLQCPHCLMALPIEELAVSDQMMDACKRFDEEVTEVIYAEGVPYTAAPPPALPTVKTKQTIHTSAAPSKAKQAVAMPARQPVAAAAAGASTGNQPMDDEVIDLD